MTLRELLPCLNYDQLLKNDIIPRKIFKDESKKVTYSKWACHNTDEFKLMVRNYILYGTEIKSDSKTIKKYKNIKRDYFKYEIKDDLIMTSDCIYEVITVNDFKIIRKEIILLMLYLFSHVNPKGIKNIGIILALQEQVMVFNLEKWNNELFKKVLYETLGNVRQCIEYYHQSNVGHHIRKKDTLYESITQERNNTFKDVQMFLSSPRSWEYTKFDEKDIEKTKTHIEKNNINYFTHAPYILNLCKPDLNLSLLKYQLKITTKISGKGVVVHLGARCKLTKEQAIENMYNNVLKIVKYIEENKLCPLLLETSVGEGTEVCYKIKSLIKFYKRFDSKSLGICVDTCHVFAAGYTPSEFISTLYENGIKVNLIHFNDSTHEKGSHRDVHMYAGQGKIGIIEMVNCLLLARKHNISTVIE